jgi:hypothetical protein
VRTVSSSRRVGAAVVAIAVGWVSGATAQSSQASYTAQFSGLVYNRSAGTFNSVLTVTNQGAALNAPLTVEISTGSAAVTVMGAASAGTGLFILTVPLTSNQLASGAVKQVVVAFADPTRVSFTPRVTSVIGGGPVASIDAPTAVLSYATVLLDGSHSVDPTTQIVRYAWTQAAGPSVTLTGATTAQATFSAPQVTSPTPVSFVLSVTDAKGATSNAKATVTVSPATTADLHVGILSTTFFKPDTTSAHSQFDQTDGPPLAGATLTVRVALSGAVQSPTFALVDTSGKVLTPLTLSLLGSPSSQPIVFGGPVTIPAVPFAVSASGTTANGQTYSVRSSPAIPPMLMTISFVPSLVRVLPGTAGSSQLVIYNGGPAATFNISYSDSNALLTAQPASSIQIAAASTATIPVTVEYPPTPASLVAPRVITTASVSGDASRVGTATLRVWDLAQ